jgi:hypothetical protein
MNCIYEALRFWDKEKGVYIFFIFYFYPWKLTRATMRYSGLDDHYYIFSTTEFDHTQKLVVRYYWTCDLMANIKTIRHFSKLS